MNKFSHSVCCEKLTAIRRISNYNTAEGEKISLSFARNFVFQFQRSRSLRFIFGQSSEHKSAERNLFAAEKFAGEKLFALACADIYVTIGGFWMRVVVMMGDYRRRIDRIGEFSTSNPLQERALLGLIPSLRQRRYPLPRWPRPRPANAQT